MASSSSSAQLTIMTRWPTSTRRQDGANPSPQVEILAAAECGPNTPAQPRDERHHDLVAAGVRHIAKEQQTLGGQLGPKRGARFKTYTRLKKWRGIAKKEMPLFVPELELVLDDIHKYPLKRSAADALNRHLRTGIDDHELAGLAIRPT